MARQARCMMLNSCPINRGRYTSGCILVKRVKILPDYLHAPASSLMGGRKKSAACNCRH